MIDEWQDQWAGKLARDSKWRAYAATLESNLFLGHLHQDTMAEFRKGDGSELRDAATRPAKMRALVSSSALAVNFFDPWRNADKRALSRALGLPSPIAQLSFEFKTNDFPVKPRSPNLDLILHLDDGRSVAVESKFSEPYRSRDGFAGLSVRYFPDNETLWSEARLPAAQRVADRLRPEWIHLDVPQLLKHLLGLANDPARPDSLIYLWFDTGQRDADAHRREIERFTREVANDFITFRPTTYQDTFRALTESEEPVEGWHGYMDQRYFTCRGRTNRRIHPDARKTGARG
ncbi:MAG: hypothetical protein AB1452_03875 [Pseudomonadota bacterium]